MRSILVTTTLAALIACAAAVPAPSPLNVDAVPQSETGQPAWVLREDIPAGAAVFGLDGEPDNETALAERDDTSPNPARLLKRSDCNGSSTCWTVEPSSCTAARNRYNDGSWYCGYTSRIKLNCEACAGCTAIFTCSNYGGACFAGWYLKNQFSRIYGEVGCGRCGSYTWSEENAWGCRVTYNYCGTWSCNDVG
ncbi:hypothetical protein B0T14DRAFT_559098 [Immersiella caudata]|uniref:Uncharacterized protein n=1 Tax=Immersiella caudata TaxID=314043 RepID=A0AA40CBI8_9PEZI|nr:hypothetical protein B0T14DRAFT_559098 [Immersiella caudata]